MGTNIREYNHSLSQEQLKRLPAEDQREVMERWFLGRYEDPVHHTPYDSGEGGYIWIRGGPYDAEEELRSEFEGIVPEEIIEALAGTLSGECSDWAPVPSEQDYDHSLLDVVSSNADAFPTLVEALDTVDRLLALTSEATDGNALRRLLFANVITALETFLSDTFINRVLADPAVLRKFFESTPEFQKRTLPYSDVFKAAETAGNEARRHLLDIVWHNLAKVQAMYRDTLGIDFGESLGAIARAVPKRHDIVHRNGKDRSGNLVHITADDVRALAASVKTLATNIRGKLGLEILL